MMNLLSRSSSDNPRGETSDLLPTSLSSWLNGRAEVKTANEIDRTHDVVLYH